MHKNHHMGSGEDPRPMKTLVYALSPQKYQVTSKISVAIVIQLALLH
jgi:hypothetical protein